MIQKIRHYIVTIFGCLLLLFAVYYAFNIFQSGIVLGDQPSLIIFELLVSLFLFVAGIGLILSKRWGIYGLMFYAVTLLPPVLNISGIPHEGSEISWYAWAGLLILVSIILFWDSRNWQSSPSIIKKGLVLSGSIIVVTLLFLIINGQLSIRQEKQLDDKNAVLKSYLVNVLAKLGVNNPDLIRSDGDDNGDGRNDFTSLTYVFFPDYYGTETRSHGQSYISPLVSQFESRLISDGFSLDEKVGKDDTQAPWQKNYSKGNFYCGISKGCAIINEAGVPTPESCGEFVYCTTW